MSKISKLFAVKDVYNPEASDALYVEAMRENCAFSYNNCKEYQKILDAKGFKPKTITKMEDIERLPFIPTATFKRHELYSMPKHRHFIKATSSGTSSGIRSKVALDFTGCLHALRMVFKVMNQRHVISLRPCHYMVLGYKPNRHNEMAVMKTAYGFTWLAPALSRTYALKYSNGSYAPDLEGIINAVLKKGRGRAPVRFMGFPAYTYFVLKMMKDRGLSVKLPEHSMIMLGGGWKQFYKEAVDKETFYQLAWEVLGIPEDRIVESFGAVEHPVLYLDCPHHHFHVPAYSRVFIRDPHTLEVLPYGRVGLVNLTTPMIKATPLLSVMTDDLGILHNEPCPCGCKSPYLEIIGRVGLKDIKTCAAGAAKLLEGGMDK
ncbi:MAG: acyl-protein synthetase [Lachnospiraceae bacterium]|nr:acyl-protein synthetase [Lachnospiraceae bacterium]